jgi:ribosomal protein S1
MSNRNVDQNKSNSQSDFGNHAFAALTLDGGKISLQSGAETAAPEPVKPAVVSPKIAPARSPIAMPRRGARLVANTPETDTGSQHQTAATAVSTPASVAVVSPAAAELTGWELLEQHRKTAKPIRGHVTRVIYNKQDSKSVVGIKARVAGIEGFVPFRMLGMNPLEAEHSVTLEMAFRVIELEKGTDGQKDRIILNRQLEIAEEKTAALLTRVKAGDTVTGIVRNIKPFGAFIDVDGASALVRVNDLPQGNVQSIKVGQKVEALVVKADRNQNQLGISIKHLAVSRLAMGDVFTGTVRNEESFGVFVQLNETVDGLVHVSQFGDFTPARGDIATVKVLGTDKMKGHVQLALLDVKAAQAE